MTKLVSLGWDWVCGCGGVCVDVGGCVCTCIFEMLEKTLQSQVEGERIFFFNYL
jgi:hypothetical protein